jgi:hypothetical protein
MSDEIRKAVMSYEGISMSELAGGPARTVDGEGGLVNEKSH